MKKVPQFHAVSTGKQPIDELIQTVAAVHPNVDAIHLREKTKTAAELVYIIEELQRSGVPLSKIIVNDRVDVACAMGVRGVHLAYHSLPLERVRSCFPSLLVGKSVHSVEEAQLAQQQGADYVFYGHIYASQSKQQELPRGLASLKAVKEAVSIPVVAIGGLTHENVHEVIQVGTDGIAVMSGVFMANHPEEQAKRYQNALQKRGGMM